MYFLQRTKVFTFVLYTSYIYNKYNIYILCINLKSFGLSYAINLNKALNNKYHTYFFYKTGQYNLIVPHYDVFYNYYRDIDAYIHRNHSPTLNIIAITIFTKKKNKDLKLKF